METIVGDCIGTIALELLQDVDVQPQRGFLNKRFRG